MIIMRLPEGGKSFERVEYHKDTKDPDMTGWYIVSYDFNIEGPCESFDCLGPYDSEKQAQRVLYRTEGFP